MKYFDGQLLIGLNFELGCWDGVLLFFELKDFGIVLVDVVGDKCFIKVVMMVEVCLFDGQMLCVVNDFFIGLCMYVFVLYEIELGEWCEV